MSHFWHRVQCRSFPRTSLRFQLLEGLYPGALYGRARQFIRNLTEEEAEQLPPAQSLRAAIPPKRNSPQDLRTIETQYARLLISPDGSIRRLAPNLPVCHCVMRCADPLICQAWYFCRTCKKWRIAAAGGCKCGGFGEVADWRRDPLTGRIISDWNEAAEEFADDREDEPDF